MASISINIPPPLTGCFEHFFSHQSQSSQETSQESHLLKAIRSVLAGTDPFFQPPNTPSYPNHDPLKPTVIQPCSIWPDHSIAYDIHNVLLSKNGILLKRWSFPDNERVQSVCITSVKFGEDSLSQKNRFETLQTFGTQSSQINDDTFGPFQRHGPPMSSTQAKKGVSESDQVAGVYIFLRSTAHLFLRTGQSYTFALPFLVRHSYPSYPHGVMIQRAFEPGELDEGELLPTVFTLTSPFLEPVAVGMMKGQTIVLDPKERIVSVSLSPPIFSTVLNERLTLWRYTYIPDTISASGSNLKTSPSQAGKTFPLHSQPSTLTTTTTMEDLIPKKLPKSPAPHTVIGLDGVNGTQKSSTSRLEHDAVSYGLTQTEMRPLFWLDQVHTMECDDDADVEYFDHRIGRSLVAICSKHRVHIFELLDDTSSMSLVTTIPGSEIYAVNATRHLTDLLIRKPDGDFSLLIDGIYGVPLTINPTIPLKEIRNLPLNPNCYLTVTCLQVLALTLSSEFFPVLHHQFLLLWSQNHLVPSRAWSSFQTALYRFLHMPSSTPLHENKFKDDIALRYFYKPTKLSYTPPVCDNADGEALIPPVLYALHFLAQSLRLQLDSHDDLTRLIPLIVNLAYVVRPEWIDYWRRYLPSISVPNWIIPPGSPTVHLPVWPPDVLSILFAKLSQPEWKDRLPTPYDIAMATPQGSSFAYGHFNPLRNIHWLYTIYSALSHSSTDRETRAREAVKLIFSTYDVETGEYLLKRLPMGIASPLHEAIRSVQISPPSDWPASLYNAVGRTDIAASKSVQRDSTSQQHAKRGITPLVAYLPRSLPSSRPATSSIISSALKAQSDAPEQVSGVDMHSLDDFMEIRFGQDRRLDEVARILCSSIPAHIKVGEMSEQDHQHQVSRVAERTLSLPYGRALFTFASLSNLSTQSLSIPPLNFTVRLSSPTNVATVTPEAGKIPADALQWGDFHNAVASALRISPFANQQVETSWVAFNKPPHGELTPSHAGLIFGLGLTGHLRKMVSWHTFAYLTPKHDLTSIAVLLGLSAANVGSADPSVTKILSVHTPALLPSPDVDLNVSLTTQAAGLSALGLLYLGTRHRRLAEVCVSQMRRKDLVQPDLSNEYREAYTLSAGLAFGMVMLGKGTNIPADTDLQNQLKVLIHGDAQTRLEGISARPAFDLNLTSPAATIALGLMYLRTSKSDVARILSIPDTVMELNALPPAFLLIRALSRALVMFDNIQPTPEWLATQVPNSVKVAMEKRFKHGEKVDDALELAYYNLIAGALFALGLKFAGTARQEAYKMIIRYHDLFTRLVFSTAANFDFRIKRSAIRDGLNTLALSLCLVMAGTGEITCFRRLRYAFGMSQQALYHPSFKSGIHVSNHMALGMLFLGSGRFTLGTSNLAIASLVTSLFPRWSVTSGDNKTYLQALRHLWVLAVEPRCLIARDVESKEMVYLPLKISLKDIISPATTPEVTQLVSPTLIPDLSKIRSIRVDTPRYWPFNLDLSQPLVRQRLIDTQVLWVKRRSAFLSYTEDPRGSRSLFVRSPSSAGEAAVLEFPAQTTTGEIKTDLSDFIDSFSNDIIFLAFADHFASPLEHAARPEMLMQTYAHATLYDAILQGKPQAIQDHLHLYHLRLPGSSSRPFFHLALHDLMFTADFYSRIYIKKFGSHRPSLLRETTVEAALHSVNPALTSQSPEKLHAMVGRYARGEALITSLDDSRDLASYLIYNAVPVSSYLVVLKDLANDAHAQCTALEASNQQYINILDQGIKEVLHTAGTRLATTLGSGWSIRSLDEIVQVWKDV